MKILRIVGCVLLGLFALLMIYWSIYTSFWRPCEDISGFVQAPMRCVQEKL